MAGARQCGAYGAGAGVYQQGYFLGFHAFEVFHPQDCLFGIGERGDGLEQFVGKSGVVVLVGYIGQGGAVDGTCPSVSQDVEAQIAD